MTFLEDIRAARLRVCGARCFLPFLSVMAVRMVTCGDNVSVTRVEWHNRRLGGTPFATNEA